MNRSIAAFLAAAILSPAANAQSRQQQTDTLIQNLTNYANSPSSVSGAQTMVTQSDNFSNGALVTFGPTIGNPGAGGGSVGAQTSGALGGAADPSANPPPETLKLVNGVQSQIQGTQPVTTQAQATTQNVNQSRPVQTQVQGVNYQYSGVYYAGGTTNAKPKSVQQRALVGTVGGQYLAGP